MSDIEKQKQSQTTVESDDITNGFSNIRSIHSFQDGHPIALEEGRQLKQDLKPRQISMIALGGALGTGLLISTTSALATAGPAGILIAYALVGALVYVVMSTLGEMSAFIPVREGFAGYATRYCDEALGFAVGIAYLCKYLIVSPNQLVAGSLVMQYWVDRDKVNPGVWVAIMLICIVAINTMGVKFFGEFEFWLSSLKVCTIVGLIITMLVIMLGGAPSHDRIGFRYWKDPGAFAPYDGITPDSKAKFVSFVSVLVTAVFAYLGTELVGITFAEAQNPRYAIKKAIKLTLFRIVIFYILSIFLVGCCVAYNDPSLTAAAKASGTAAASPFLVAINNAQIKGLNHVLNACILIFVFSASNSDLYISSRNAYGLACNGMFPKIFSKTDKRGVPIYALGLATLFCLLAFMVCDSSSKTIFNYFVNVVSIFGLLTWISILVTYLYFKKAVEAQGYNRKADFVYYSPFQPYSTYIALAICCLIAIIKNFTVFLGDEFDYKTFITGYIGIPVYLICLATWKIVKHTKTVKPDEADLITYKDDVDKQQYEYEQQLAEKKAVSGGKLDRTWWYDHTLGLLF